MIVLDASILIAHFTDGDVHHDRATQLLADHRGHDYVASVVTIAELLVGPARAGRSADAVEALTRLGVTPIGVGTGDSAKLADLRATSNLKLPDCCVLLAAQSNSAAVVTFDDRMLRAARELNLAVISSTGE